MKKILCLIVALLLITGCNKETVKEDVKEDVSIIGSWEREIDYVIEKINFLEDGHYSYYSDEGNPVDDSDLCSSYKIENDTIKLTCEDDSVLDEIKIISKSKDEIKLSFDNEERIFKKVIEEE